MIEQVIYKLLLGLASGVVTYCGKIVKRFMVNRETWISEYDYRLNRKVLYLIYYPLFLCITFLLVLMCFEEQMVELLMTYVVANIICIVGSYVLIRCNKLRHVLENTIIMFFMFNIMYIDISYEFTGWKSVVSNLLFIISVIISCCINVKKEKVREVSYHIYCKDEMIVSEREPIIKEGYVLVYKNCEEGREIIKLNKEQFIKYVCNIRLVEKVTGEERETEVIEKKENILINRNIWNIFLIIVVSAVYINSTRVIFKGWLHLICLFLGLLTLILFAGYRWFKEKRISFLNILAIIGLELRYLKVNDGELYTPIILSILAMIFAFLVTFALKLVWDAFRVKKGWVVTLILALSLIHITFASLYSSFYAMYSSKNLRCFEINENMSYSQSLLMEDFLYYSGDMLFGTSLSNVRIKYIDIDQLEDDQVPFWPKADDVIHIVKLVSLFESVVFIIYIGIIIVRNKEENEEQLLELVVV